MAEETQYIANTGVVTIATANSNLDGTGTVATVLTAGSNGTLIKSVIIKSQTTTSRGMIRLYISNGSAIQLVKEVFVPAIIKSAINPAFEAKVNLDITIRSGYTLKVSSQTADTFNVIAEGLDWTYHSSSVRTDTTMYTSKTGAAAISVANSNLNGSGTMVAAYNAGSSTDFNGSSVKSITIKSAVTDLTTAGMIRLFLDTGGSKILFSEIFVPTSPQSGSKSTFERTIVFENDFDIRAGWSIMAATENAQAYKVTAEGCDWTYLG